MDFRNEQTDRLIKAILNLQNEQECYDFFEDLCTIKEIQDMSQRLEAAKRLYDGENYLAISREIGISTATISRVSRCLNYGNGGYKTAIERMNEDENK